MTKLHIKYNPDQFGYCLAAVFKDGREYYHHFYPSSQAELNADVKELLSDAREWGFCEEVERVYATRIDCMAVPEGVRRAA